MAIRILHAIQSMAVGGTAAGVRSVIASLRPPRFEHFVIVEQLSEAERAATPGGALLHAVPPCPSLLWGQRLMAIRRLIRHWRIDVVHGRGWPGTDALVAACSVPGVALVLSAHGRSTQQPPARTWSQCGVFKWLGPRLDCAFGVTPELAAELARDIGWKEQNVEVVLNAVDTTRYTPRTAAPRDGPGRPLRVGVAGRLVPVKRIDLVLSMAQRVLRERGDEALRVEIAGDGPLRGTVKADIRRLGLEQSVLMRGHVEDMVRWYQEQDVFLSSSDFEGCSNVVLEALACAVPVIATDVGMNRMLLGDGQGGVLVSAGNADALAEAVIFCMEEPGRAAHLGREGYRLLKESSLLQNHRETYTQLYERSVRPQRRPVRERNRNEDSISRPAP